MYQHAGQNDGMGAAPDTGRSDVRRRDADATYRRILDRAVERFDESGPAGIVVTAIASEAGVSVGALYHHFSGRTGLVAAARIEQFRRTTEADLVEIERAAGTAAPCAELRGFNRALVRRNREPGRVRARRERLAALAAATDDPETAIGITEAQRQLTDGLTRCAELARDRGWFRPDVDPRAWAAMIQGLLLGAVVVDLDPTVDEALWIGLVELVQDLAIREDPQAAT